MEKKDIRSEALEFIKKRQLAVLSTVSAEGRPQSALILYAADDDMNLYFATRRQTRKFENLIRNKNAAAVIGIDLGSQTMQIEGVVEHLSTHEDDFLKAISFDSGVGALYSGPFLKMKGIDFAVFKLTPFWMRMLHVDPETGEERYDQII